nr:GNAT family N-acetyltransferase [Halobacillus andaensis]
MAIFHKQLRIESTPPGFIKEETDHVIRHVSKFNEDGFISASNVNEQNAEQIIQEELNYFINLGQRFEWKVYSYDQPPYLIDLLKEQGFTIEDREALMVMEIDQDHPFLEEITPALLKEITDEAGIKEMISLIESIWEGSFSMLGERLWRDKQDDPDSLFLYGVYEDGRLVSGAWMYVEKGTSFASFWGGATRPESRGKGFYSSLLAVRAQKAYQKGYRFMTVDASPMSQPILEKNGFTCLAYSYGCQSPDPKDREGGEVNG